MIGMTLLVRDEIDIIRPWLEHHCGLADMLIVTDNGSVDGTREVLDEWGVEVIDEPAHDYMQHQWVDRMIRRLIDAGCEWVANSDADELWRVDLHALASAAPASLEAYRVPCCLYVPTTADDPTDPNPITRMRHYTTTGRNHKERQCINAWHKLFHRTANYQRAELGNHKMFFAPGAGEIVDCAAGRIDHYPNRSWTQYRRKYCNGGEAYSRSTLAQGYGWHWRERYDAYCTGGSVELKKWWYREIDEPDHLEADA